MATMSEFDQEQHFFDVSNLNIHNELQGDKEVYKYEIIIFKNVSSAFCRNKFGQSHINNNPLDPLHVLVARALKQPAC